MLFLVLREISEVASCAGTMDRADSFVLVLDFWRVWRFSDAGDRRAGMAGFGAETVESMLTFFANSMLVRELCDILAVTSACNLFRKGVSSELFFCSI